MNAHILYSAFGRTIASPLPLPAPVADPTSPIDITIELATLQPEPGDGALRTISSAMRIGIEPGCWTLFARGLDPAQRYTAGIERDRITVGWNAGVEPEDVARHMVGPAIAAHGWLTGNLCLHGCAVQSADGSALVILGESGRGKSTLTAALVAGGHALIAEEYLLLPPASLAVLPGIPALKISDMAADRLRLAGGAQPAFVHRDYSHEGVIVPLAPIRFAAGAPLPVGTILLLDPRGFDHTPHLSAPLPGGEAAREIAAHGYWAPHLPPAERNLSLRRALELASACPVRRLKLPDDLAALPEAVATLDQFLAGAPR